MRESALPWSKERGHKRKDRSWKMEVHIDAMKVIKTNAAHPITLVMFSEFTCVSFLLD